MSVLTDYYVFEKIATKSKTRLDCTASTMSYPEFEEKRATKATNIGDLLVYFGDVPEQFGGNIHRKADKAITIKGKNLSSVYVPDPSNNFGYGDVRGSADALLFVFEGVEVVNGVIPTGAAIEVFVARGKSKDRVPLYNLLTDGELDEEMSELRARANELQLPNQ